MDNKAAIKLLKELRSFYKDKKELVINMNETANCIFGTYYKSVYETTINSSIMLYEILHSFVTFDQPNSQDAHTIFGDCANYSTYKLNEALFITLFSTEVPGHFAPDDDSYIVAGVWRKKAKKVIKILQTENSGR